MKQNQIFSFARPSPTNSPPRLQNTFKEDPPLLPPQEIDELLPPSDFDAEAWFATPELRAPANKTLLEIVVSWEGVILDIGHYQTPRRISFGTNANADFHFPLELASDDPTQTFFFPLVEPAKNGFLLCFYPEMDGTVEENGERLTLLDLVKEGRAHCFHRSGRCCYPLLPGVVAKFHCKGLEIQLRHVLAPQFSLNWSRHLGTYAPVLSFSIITHLLMALMAILSISPSAPPPTPPPATVQTETPVIQETVEPQINTPTRIQLDPIHLCIIPPQKRNEHIKKRKKTKSPTLSSNSYPKRPKKDCNH